MPISPSDLKAWFDLMGIVPTPQEARLMIRIDVEYRAAIKANGGKPITRVKASDPKAVKAAIFPNTRKVKPQQVKSNV